MLSPELQTQTSISKVSALHPEANCQQAFTLVRHIEDYVISVASAVKNLQVKVRCLTSSPQNKQIDALTEKQLLERLILNN